MTDCRIYWKTTCNTETHIHIKAYYETVRHLPFIFCMHISTMLQQQLDNACAIVSSSQMQWC